MMAPRQEAIREAERVEVRQLVHRLLPDLQAVVQMRHARVVAVAVVENGLTPPLAEAEAVVVEDSSGMQEVQEMRVARQTPAPLTAFL